VNIPSIISTCMLVLIATNIKADAFVSDETGANIDTPHYMTPAQYQTPDGKHNILKQQKTKINPQGNVYGLNGVLPSYPSELAAGKGQNLVKSYCAICHSTTYITNQPPLSSKHWQEIVDKMRFKFGAKNFINDEQEKAIVTYLQAHYTPETQSHVESTVNTNSEEKVRSETSSVKFSGDLTLGKSTFVQNCAACHQTNGEGLSGAFPPLKDHAAELFNTDGGRSYLAKVVMHGLSGQISVNKDNYNGNMPAWKSVLNDEKLAAVLNYILLSWGNDKRLTNDFSPYTAEELEAVRKLDISPEKMTMARSQLNLLSGSE